MATNLIRDLVHGLVADGVHLYVDGSELKYRARKGAIQEADRTRVKENKTAIVEYLCKLQQIEVEQAAALPPIERVARDGDGPVPLSFSQQRLWFIDRLGMGRSQYNMPGSYLLGGELDIRAFERALQSLLERHEVLRTHFVEQDGVPRQVVAARYALPLQLYDISALSEQERSREASRMMREEAGAPFDLSRDLMLRVRVLKLSEKQHLVLYTMHHIASDGWSGGIFRNELGALYGAYSSGKENPLQPLKIQYADFAQWQRRWLRGEVLAEQMSYWREQLTGLPSLLTLPTDRPRPAEQTFRGSTESFVLPVVLGEKLQALSREQGVTLYMTLLAAFAVLLGLYAGQQDVAVGTPIANRRRRETEGLIGLLLNTLVMRLDMSGDPRFVELLKRTRQVALQAFAHQDIPFEHLVEELNPERSLSHSPLFQVMFMLQNMPLESLELTGLAVQPLAAEAAEAGDGAPEGTAQFDLTLSAQETPAGLVCVLEYNTDLFERNTIRRMADHYSRLLQAIVAAPQSRLSQIGILSGEERRLLLLEWNATARAYPQEKCIHELFAEQVARTPEAIAVVDGSEQLTYTELNGRANQLAHYLRLQGVGPEQLVALYMERGKEMLVGLLGILKAGGAYVPLDPRYPADRVVQVLQDARPRALLTQRHLLDGLSGYPAALCLDTDWHQVASQPVHAPETGACADHLAYVIYTSGSTGKPKGVQVEHRSVRNLSHAYSHGIYLEQGRAAVRVAMNASLAFDASVSSYLLLLQGDTVCIVPEQVRAAPAELARFLAQQRIDVIECVPSQMKYLLEELDYCPKLLLLGGEAVESALWSQLSDLRKGVVVNTYGPTECTIEATYCPIDAAHGTPSIGRPLPNMQIYVLDAHLQPVPIGITGEIYIGGACVTRGYLNRPALTAERFLADPFGDRAGGRVYRTGDLGRWRADGNLEYVGRNDSQVKVRGYRIELGEIENALLAHDAVRDAVVVAREENSGDKRLVGYVVAEAGAQSDDVALVSTLRTRLQEQLPAYMVPSAFVVLERLPLTTTGKLDRKALPAPEGSALTDYAAPKGVTEELLAGLWCALLKRERVGRHDNFFELGGHSLLVTQLASRIRETFSTELPLRQVFEHPALSAQARAVERASGAGVRTDLPMVAVSRDAPLPLSYAQQRLWFLHQYLGPGAVYNMPLALRLHGEVNEAALVQSLQELHRRHESLRTRFETHEGNAVQVIDPPELDLEVEVVSVAEAQTIAHAERSYHFDLLRERLCRIRVLRETGSESGDYALLVTMHHGVSDGWSLGIFFQELMSLYEAYARGESSPLAPLPLQYADYAQWQRLWLQGEVLEEQLSYWREQLKELPPLLTLPTDRPRPAEQTFRGSTEHFALPLMLSGKLQALSREQGVTLYMTLLSAFAVLLGRYAGQQDVALGTPIANRTRRETEGLIGFFVNTLVMRHDLSGDPRFIDLLKDTRETALQAYAHQDVPFEQLVEALNPERSLSHSPLFQVMFMLQNMPFDALEMQGLAVQPLEAGAAEGPGEGAPEGTARFNLTLGIQESPSGLVGGLEYNTDLFDRSTILRMVTHYERLLEAIVASPQSRLSRLEMQGEAERQQQLVDWNATSRVYQEKCIHELFEAQARQRPDAVALVHEQRELTYGELHRRSNRLAHQLIERGVGPEVRVGLCLPRSAEMVIGILGILKAGGCYVPLEPDYPRQRLDYLLEDSRIELIVTEPGVAARVTGPGRELLLLAEAGTFDGLAGGSLEDVDPVALGLRSEHPAYLIYTSASTGPPKGVVALHRSIVNRVNWLAGSLGVGAQEVLCQKTSLAFVDHVAEIFQALSAGVPLVIISTSLLQAPRELLRELDARRVTQLTLVPSLLKTVLESAEGGKARWLRSIYSSGEALHSSGLERLAECFPQARLFNVYGSTEMGADVTCHEMTAESLRAEGAGHWASIGTGIDNTQAYILDANGQLAVSGALGELHVGGVCLARGYFQRAGLTAEKYVPNGFARTAGERLYKTGDLARRRPDGTLEYVGRMDTQVKVRGHRIELGEIESVLRAHEAVRNAVVVAREQGAGDRRLVGYVVAEAGAQADEVALIQELRGRLQEQLPGYMVPSAFVVLASLPLTATGKLDRKALPAPEASALTEYVAPEGVTEELMAALWCALLKRERVGRHDNFFELGGHSMLAVRLVYLIRQEFATELPLQVLFESPTVASLSTRLGLAQQEFTNQDGVEWVTGSL